jgi:toxin FitB
VTIPSASKAVVVDSSGWLEYIAADSKAELFAVYFEGQREILVPAIVLYEVRKILLLKFSRQLADAFVSEALRRTIVALDENMALAAVDFSIQYQLPMGDAFLYAAARSANAEFVTSDAHFKGLPGVTFL